MGIIGNIGTNPFTVNNVPIWNCPICKTGMLIGNKSTIKGTESSGSKAARKYDEWEPEWISGNFGGKLKCSNQICGETILLIEGMEVQSHT